MKELDQYLCLSQDKEDSQPQLTLHEIHMKVLFQDAKTCRPLSASFHLIILILELT